MSIKITTVDAERKAELKRQLAMVRGALAAARADQTRNTIQEQRDLQVAIARIDDDLAGY